MLSDLPPAPPTAPDVGDPVDAGRDVQTRRRTRLAVHPGWIVVAAACAIIVRQAVHSGLNTDAFWQLAAGNWMLAHHTVIRSDVFSYTIPGHPWVAEEWGFEVLLAWMVAHLGSVSYWILSGGVSAGALVVSAARWRRLGAGGLWMAGLSVLVAFALVLGVAPRPQDLSYLLFAVELLVLTLARQRRGWLLVLPPLMLVWANVHGSFLAGLAILGLEVVLSVLAARRQGQTDDISFGRRASLTPLVTLRLRSPLRPRDALAVFAAGLVAAMINPHGPGLLTYAFRVSTSSNLSTNIQEWLSPNFHDPIIFVAVAVPVLLALVVLATGRMQTDLFDLVVWLALVVATFHSIRFAPYMGLAFGGMAAGWGSSFRDLIPRTPLTLLIAPLLFVAFLTGPHPAAGTPQTTGSLAAPTAAVKWLGDRPGRVFSTYVWNDYLISQGIPVFVDGRTDMYFGTGVLSTYAAVSSLQEAPDPVLSKWNVQWVLWPSRSPLSVYLSHDAQWHLVRQFGSQQVFERS